MRLDLEREPSGIASAVFEATAFTVYDTAGSGVVSRPPRRCGRSEERRVRPAARRGARDRGDLRRDARRAAGLLDRGPHGDADARLGGGRRARAAARRRRARGGAEAKRGAARAADRPAPRGACAEQRARPAGRPAAARRPARRSSSTPTPPTATSSTASAASSAASRCTASHRSLLGFEFPIGHGLAGAAVREGRPLIESAYGEIAAPVPHPAYDGFTDVITAPMFWSDEVRGVLGVGRREGRRFDEPGREHPRGVRGARVARAAQRRDVHAERAAGADPARLLPDRVGARAVALPRGDARGDRAGCGRGARRRSAAVLVPLERAARRRRDVRAAGRRSRDRSSSGRPEQRRARSSAPRREGRILVVARRSPTTSGCCPTCARRPPRAGYRVAPLRAGRGAARRGPAASSLIFFAEERVVQRRRPRARPPSRRRDARRARAQRAVRGRAQRPRARAAADAHRPAAHERARPGGGARRGRAAGAGARQRRRRRVPAARRARSSSSRAADGEGAEAALGSRSPAGGWLSGDVVQSGARRSRSRTPATTSACAGSTRCSQAGHAAFLGVPVGGAGGSAARRARRLRRACRASGARRRSRRCSRVAASTSAALVERRAVPARRARAGAVGRDPRQHRRGNRRRRPRGQGRPLEQRRRDDHRRPRRRSRSAARRSTCCSGASSRRTTRARGDRLVPIMRGREEVWLSVTEAVMRDPLGAVAGRIFAFRDISGDRLVEQVKSDFVSTVSHELRTPLTSIYGFAETLLRQDVMFGEEERQTFLALHRLGVAAADRRSSTRSSTSLGSTRATSRSTSPRRTCATSSARCSTRSRAAEVNGHRFVVELPEEPLAATRRPREAAPGVLDPRRERAALLAGRRHRDRRRRAAAGHRRGQRRRRGDRDPAVRPGADLPQVLPRRRRRARAPAPAGPGSGSSSPAAS